jgi:hypothetical protein
LSVEFKSTLEPVSNKLLSAPPDIANDTNEEAMKINNMEKQIPTTTQDVRPVNVVHIRDKRPGVFSFFVFLAFVIKSELTITENAQ